MAFDVTVCVVVEPMVLELSVLHLPYQRLPDHRPHNRHDRASGSFYYPNRRRVDIPFCHNYNYWYMYCLPSSPQALNKNKNQKVTTGNWIQTHVRQFVLAIRRGFPNKAVCSLMLCYYSSTSMPLYICLLFHVPFQNISLIWRPHHWKERFRAIPSVPPRPRFLRSSPKYKIRPNIVVFYDKPGVLRICSNPDPTGSFIIAIPQNMFINSLVENKTIFLNWR